MSKAIQKTEAQVPANALQNAAENGFRFDPNNVTLPRILLVQKMSAVVDTGDFKAGEIRNSLTNEKLGGVGDPFEVIPLSFKEVWTYVAKEGNKFIKIEDLTAANKDLPWEDTITHRDEEIEVKRQKTFQFMVLIVKGLGEDQILPAQISFKVKSLRAGKDLNSLVMQRVAMGQEAYTKTAKISSLAQKVGDHGFHIFAVAPGEKTNDEQRRLAAMWTKELRQNTFRVQEEEVDSDSAVASDEKAEY